MISLFGRTARSSGNSYNFLLIFRPKSVGIIDTKGLDKKIIRTYLFNCLGDRLTEWSAVTDACHAAIADDTEPSQSIRQRQSAIIKHLPLLSHPMVWYSMVY